MNSFKRPLPVLAVLAALALAACGGGGGSATDGTAAASSAAYSSGTVTAFGSIFVNGHEFSTQSAQVIDDDAGTATAGTAGLEVGMSVDVKAADGSTDAHPAAAEVHLHPLARGVVDGSDGTAGTLTVMGQTIQLTASTNFSDHRACLSAATPCAAVTGQSGLGVTSGSGASAVAGSYVTVHGYLFNGGSGGANIVATLVSVRDPLPLANPVAYKVEGVVTATGSSQVTIGGLSVDLSGARCYAKGSNVACASAFSTGQVVAAIGATAPSLPAASFTAGAARLRSKLVVETAGATLELEGRVSSVTASPASFVVRGVTVDASALASLPAAGDVVEVKGTVAGNGTSVTATSVKVLHAALAASYGFEGDVTGVAAGSAADTFVITVLGQSIMVDARTRLADRTRSEGGDPASNPFNITTFQAYLAASGSRHVLVRTEADASGNLSALSLVIVPASTVASVGGTVDASPAPVNGTAGTTPTTFAVHGLPVSADAASVLKASVTRDGHGFDNTLAPAAGTVAAGDFVLARGTFGSGMLTVAAPAGGPGLSRTNVVIDFGTLGAEPDHDVF
jgi:hypothetical protein